MNCPKNRLKWRHCTCMQFQDTFSISFVMDDCFRLRSFNRISIPPLLSVRTVSVCMSVRLASQWHNSQWNNSKLEVEQLEAKQLSVKQLAVKQIITKQLAMKQLSNIQWSSFETAGSETARLRLPGTPKNGEKKKKKRRHRERTAVAFSLVSGASGRTVACRQQISCRPTRFQTFWRQEENHHRRP